MPTDPNVLPWGDVPPEHWPWSIALTAVFLLGLLYWYSRARARSYLLDLAENERTAQEARSRMESLARESQGKTELLATLSREVRGHLHGIIGSTDLLLDEKLPPQAADNIRALRVAAESLQRSVNDILDFSSVESGQLRLARAPFDLIDLMAGVAEQLETAARRNGVDILLIVPPELQRRVVGDAARLRQVLLTIVGRAVALTLGGRVILRVEVPSESAAPSRTGATWMRFSITDSSTGISDSQLAALFDPPPPPDLLAPRKPSVRSLELFVCRRMVEFMGGSIGARRMPDIGAETWTVLPLEPDPAPVPTPVDPIPAGLYVVVLDTDGPSRVCLSTQLARLGVAHDAVAEYVDAVELLNEPRAESVTSKILIADETALMINASRFVRYRQALPAGDSVRLVLLVRDPERVRASVSILGHAVMVRRPVLRARTLLEALGVAPSPAERVEPRVLVVDDDDISRSVAVQLLERQGCVAVRSGSGKDAVRRIEEESFDLIFMDCQMPDPDGYETTRRIRAKLGEAAPPIVALTASTAPADRERAFAAGMVDFVEKPVRRSELCRVVDRWIPRAVTAPSRVSEVSRA